MKCGCGTQLKELRFEDQENTIFCPRCIPKEILAALTGAGQGIEDYKPDSNEGQQGVVSQKTTSRSKEDKQKENPEEETENDNKTIYSES